MEIIPAIDIQGSNVVRLFKGDFNNCRVYSDSPVKTALMWQELGAKRLHIVDLDGARKGRAANRENIKEITENCSFKVQVGGGIRNRAIMDDLLDIGVENVIVGTLAGENFIKFKESIKGIEKQVIVAVDVKENNVVSRGWVKENNINYIDFIKKIEDTGIDTVIYTDVLRDGTLTDPNYDAIENILENTEISIIASGGISSILQIDKLFKMENKGLKGVILGKSLYENKISYSDCVKKYGF